jgi:hypothetical protein
MSYLSEHVLKTLNIEEKPSCVFNCDETDVYFIAFKTLKCMLYSLYKQLYYKHVYYISGIYSHVDKRKSLWLEG